MRCAWRRSTRLLALAALAWAPAACGTSLQPEDPGSVESWMELFEVPGASLAVIRDSEIAYVETYGVMSRNSMRPVTDRTLFQAASISKSVSAAGVLALVRDGIVDLDRDVNAYLTSWELPYGSGISPGGVTLRRLLSHTAGTTVSGFRGYRLAEPVPTLIQILNGQPPANSGPVFVEHEPGSRFQYSGGGYEVMELALADVTGQWFPDLIRERILGPMGMAGSTYEQPLPDTLQDLAAWGYYANGRAVPGGHHTYPEIAAAALWATPSDVALFLIDMQQAIKGRPGTVLRQDEASLLLTEVERDYGLGFDLWTYGGQPYFGHRGANDGFRGGMLAHLSSGDGLVLLTNSDRGSELYDAVVQLIGEREGWPGF